jgi:hypothetical protein
MTTNGEAYIMTLNKMPMMPTIKDRSLFEWARVKTKGVTTQMNISSISNSSKIMSLFFLSEKIKKMIMYVSSMAIPGPSIVNTKVLWGCTIGRPYKVQTMQFTRVTRYGAGE